MKFHTERNDHIVKVKWDFGDTDLEGIPYNKALKESGLPDIVNVPYKIASKGDDAISDWLSDEYGFTHFGWVDIQSPTQVSSDKKPGTNTIRNKIIKFHKGDSVTVMPDGVTVFSEFIGRIDNIKKDTDGKPYAVVLDQDDEAFAVDLDQLAHFED